MVLLCIFKHFCLSSVSLPSKETQSLEELKQHKRRPVGHWDMQIGGEKAMD